MDIRSQVLHERMVKTTPLDNQFSSVLRLDGVRIECAARCARGMFGGFEERRTLAKKNQKTLVKMDQT